MKEQHELRIAELTINHGNYITVELNPNQFQRLDSSISELLRNGASRLYEVRVPVLKEDSTFLFINNPLELVNIWTVPYHLCYKPQIINQSFVHMTLLFP